MDNDSKIFVAGHNGLVGSAIVRNLELNGHTNIITRTRDELDLTNSHAVGCSLWKKNLSTSFLQQQR